MTKALSPLYTASQQFDADGVPLAGGKLYTYIAGTTTPKATFTDITGLVQNSNPIVLDSSGYLPNAVWVTPGAGYKFELRDADGNIIPGHTTDNVSFGGGGGGGSVLPVNEIGFGTGVSIGSSRQFQYNPDVDVDPDINFGMVEVWDPNEEILVPYFRMGCTDAAPESGGTTYSIQANVSDPDTDPIWVTPIKIDTNQFDNTAKVIMTDVRVDSLTGINLVNTVVGANGIGPSYSTVGDVTVGLTQPQKTLVTTQAVTNTETYIPVTGFSCWLQPGTTYRIKIVGTCTSAASGSTTWRMKIGTDNSTADSTYLTFATTTPASGTNIPFTLEMELSCRTDGTSGQIVTSAFLVNNGTTGISNAAVVASSGAISTIDTTAGNYLGVSAQTSSTNISLSIRQMCINRVL